MEPNDAVGSWQRGTSRPLLTPDEVHRSLPLTGSRRGTVQRGRDAVSAILRQRDDRLLVVVGPCSIHDPVGALEYARRLALEAAERSDELCIVMRTYFEKPRSTSGWRGLISDPGLDGTYRVSDGLLAARALVLQILSLGVPVGCEFVDPLTTPYLADAVSWGSIGARTTQSPIHRQLASGLPMPVGFKNAPDGDVQTALDAAASASSGQSMLGMTGDGRVAVVDTTGNPDSHVVLRGGTSGPNFDAATVAGTRARLVGSGLPEQVVIDASHGNSDKDHRRQAVVVASIAERLMDGEPGIAGLMLESFLVDGRQPLEVNRVSPLTFGQSVTDACMDWDTTAVILKLLAGAVTKRRMTASGRSGLATAMSS